MPHECEKDRAHKISVFFFLRIPKKTYKDCSTWDKSTRKRPEAVIEL